jgi:Cu-Zn family superoxide dismutase
MEITMFTRVLATVAMLAWSSATLQAKTHTRKAAMTNYVPMHDRSGKQIGEVSLQTSATGSLFSVQLSGVASGWHAIHLHENPDCSDGDQGFLKAGGHANPQHKKHGFKSTDGFHLGDLANVYVFPTCEQSTDKSSDGVAIQARSQQILAAITSADAPRSYAVILHEHPDDYITDPHGMGGKRIGCAVVSTTSPYKNGS